MKGKAIGLEQRDKLAIDRFIENLKKASKNTSELILLLESKGIDVKHANLKVNSFDDFSLLVAISEEDFLSDNLDSSFVKIKDMENSVRT